jgi:hypothetical protein
MDEASAYSSAALEVLTEHFDVGSDLLPIFWTEDCWKIPV